MNESSLQANETECRKARTEARMFHTHSGQNCGWRKGGGLDEGEGGVWATVGGVWQFTARSVSPTETDEPIEMPF